MKPEERLKDYPRYPTVRGEVCYQLYKAMAEDENVWLVTGDLGYKQFDAHREDFPERFINCGASEQAMIGIACGLAVSGKKPFVYSITNFLIYRPFEWIRNYVNHDKIPVRLLGSGLGRDYLEDGFSHQCNDIHQTMKLFKKIQKVYPTSIKSVQTMMGRMVKEDKPWFMGITRL